MPTSLNHIGIAVSDPQKMAGLLAILGVGKSHEEAVPEQGVNTQFFAIQPAVTHIELLIATDPEGPVGKFLGKRGPGIHHISFEVDSAQYDDICDKLKQGGIICYMTKPRPELTT